MACAISCLWLLSRRTGTRLWLHGGPTSYSCAAAFCTSSAAARMASPRITFAPPERSLFDRPLAISVKGLRPLQEITLRASLRDERDGLFEAFAFYRADSVGRLDLSRSPALEGGSFSGLEPMGLLWALKARKPFKRLRKSDVRRPFLLELEVLEGHRGPGEREDGAPGAGVALAQAVHELHFLGDDGVTRVPVREGAIRATLFLPPGNGSFPGIIDISGADGGLHEHRACLMAHHGFATLALAYFGYDDLPNDTSKFHLEYFEEAVNYMLEHPKVRGPGIGLLGHSKGGNLCISMATFLKGITCTVTINGSVANVVGSLHYKDLTIPPLGLDINRVKLDKAGVADIVDVLNNPLEGPDRQSFIPLEKADGCFLFIVGEDDHNWKSDFFAVEASKRLQAHGKERPEIISYPGTGHFIEPPYFPMCAASLHFLVGCPAVWGGEPKAHAAAQVDAWQQIRTYFYKHLGGKIEKSKL